MKTLVPRASTDSSPEDPQQKESQKLDAIDQGTTMKENPLRKLQALGQSIWLDYIRRDLISSGELRRLIEVDGLRGITSNPTIFEKSITAAIITMTRWRIRWRKNLSRKVVVRRISRTWRHRIKE